MGLEEIENHSFGRGAVLARELPGYKKELEELEYGQALILDFIPNLAHLKYPKKENDAQP